MGFVVRVLVNGVAIWLATVILPGLTVIGGDSTAGSVGVILLVALVFGIVNAIVKPVVALLSLPLYILTLGLFTLVVNALMLMLTAWITGQTSWGLRIDNFGTAVLGALIVSLVSFALSSMTSRD
ncbi:phage holin family protein [Cellulomonas dongxiuzhuiae]|uniref:Phage holin family protein n=1 Tax=Cellulomonas dongxiuzhuiae TaxID=2819979 RepID=A0ABX8GJR0_9CELL|nr:phage holin family protein [Cellulomonas dongxiuzhuiae]MBO3089343.1 phage holin family protein [Cellulomonas dongxiuzhuiae]MBO3094871.1 phage holin family protein [Cellulomonas dongxiuzhuiae]QWC15901.1 phage holin family protein [Cellulomonas dongxiuzhuiae]